MTDQLRLIIAVIISTAILFGWQYFFMEEIPTHTSTVDAPLAALEEPSVAAHFYERDALIQEGLVANKRLKIYNEYVDASINLVGAKIDDLVLKKYNRSADSVDQVVLLSPKQTEKSYLAEFGWLGSHDSKAELPTTHTLWTVVEHGNQYVHLKWISAQQVQFDIQFTLDNKYMFDVTQTVKNLSESGVTLYHYASINRSFEQDESNAIVHEGAIAVLNDKLEEASYGDLREKKIDRKQQSGWIGFSDKYWLVAIIPNYESKFDARFSFINSAQSSYQGDIIQKKNLLEPSQSLTETTRFFAGSKNIDLLHKYQSDHHISLFDRAVDFGVLYFITKPIFLLLNYFYRLLGNFGFAILLLTVLMKLLLFPLAYKGFVSMNKLKVLQPQLAAIKEKCGGDAIAFQKAVMEFYKKEKVNPMSGCLPIALQMPVFFALYKVLSVTIEMRQAHFFGWIKDLSLPDPLTILNLFGLLPFELPSFLMIGILPMIMAFTMYVQQNLNPAPSDPIQANMMKYLPVIFLFVFASFPSGLVLYWTWSNILSILQQIVIKRLSK